MIVHVQKHLTNVCYLSRYVSFNFNAIFQNLVSHETTFTRNGRQMSYTVKHEELPGTDDTLPVILCLGMSRTGMIRALFDPIKLANFKVMENFVKCREIQQKC